MSKSLKIKNIIRRIERRSDLYHQGLSAPQMAKRLKTNAHNVRIFISNFRRRFPDLTEEVFPYKYANNWLINKKR